MHQYSGLQYNTTTMRHSTLSIKIHADLFHIKLKASQL